MVQVVWDSARQGTGSTRSGAAISVGGGATFSSDDLLGLSAVTCLMGAFLSLAEAQAESPLSYLSTAAVLPADAEGHAPHVQIRTYITAASEDHRRKLQTLMPLAKRRSPVACLLGAQLDLQTEFQVLAGADSQ